MVKQKLFRATILTVSIALLLPGAVLMGQHKMKTAPNKKSEEPKPIPADAKSILWQEPTDIATRDLFLGPGGDSMKPDLSSVTFIADETRSYSTRYRVRDGAGNEWVVKLGKEAQPETAATRLVWAAGYLTNIAYLAPRVEIQGKGTFENACFKGRPKGEKRLDIRWDWSKNPFVGTRELQGLKVLEALIGNWDIQAHNNNVLLVSDKATGEKVAEYIDTDLGASFAKEGRFIGHTRNQPDEYVKAKFIKGVDHGYVVFDFRGKNQHLLKGITVEQAKWIGGILSQLSDQQISDAFRAANYSPEEIEALTQVVKARINELVSLPG
jgi:hypothetical protein